MKFPRIHFSMMSMMLVVAVMAILLGTWIVRERRAKEFRRLSSRHSILSTMTGALSADINTPLGHKKWEHLWYHNTMARKYQDALNAPWAEVPPDTMDPDPDCEKNTREMMNEVLRTRGEVR